MLRSALENASEKFDFALGYDKSSLSSINLEVIKNVCASWNLEVSFFPIELDIETEFDNYLTATTYARLILADNFIDPFIWIDADVMCSDGWDKIFSFARNDLNNLLVIGVQDPLVRKSNESMNLSNAAVDIAREKYFNAGVVIIDPNAWRHYEVADKWRSAQLNYLQLGLEYHDQCILNYVSANKSLIISGEFNYIVRNDEERTYKNPKIVHFAGGFKPWHMPEFALWLLAPKKDRDLYRKYAYFQIKTFMSVFLHRPDLGLKLWKKRLDLRRTDSLLRILKQKWKWWLDGKRRFANSFLRQSIRRALKIPVISKLWAEHIRRTENFAREEIERVERLGREEIERVERLGREEIERVERLGREEIEKLKERYAASGYTESLLEDLSTYGNYNIFYSSVDKTFESLCDLYGTDKGTGGNPKTELPWPSHNYSDFYTKLFKDERSRIKKVFECGIGTNNENVASNMTSRGIPGASLRVWKNYFPNAQIFGVDIDKSILFEEERISTHFMDQTNEESIRNYWSSLGQDEFDIMIDDGLHTFEAAVELFKNSYGFLKKGGKYIIEDIPIWNAKEYLKYFETQADCVSLIAVSRIGLELGDNVLLLIEKQL